MSENHITLPSQPSEQLVMSETPAERISEKTTMPTSTPQIAHAAHVTQRITNLEAKVANLKGEVAEIKGTLVQMQQVQHVQQQDLSTLKAIFGQVLTKLLDVPSTQSTTALQRTSDTTKREKEGGQEKGQGAVDQSKGKEVITEV